MAIVVPHQSGQGIATASAGQAAQYRNASAFMTPGQENFGPGLQQLAGGLGKLGGVIFDAEIRKRQEQMELALLEDMQAFQSESQAWADNYQQQNQGKNAVNAATDAQSFYKDKVDALRQRWEGNERAQLYIQRNAGGVALSGVNAMRDYGNKQQDAWKDSVFAGQMATFKDVASDWRSTPEEIQTAYKDFAGKNTAYLMSKGMDPTAAQTQTDRVYREAMAARTEQSFMENISNGNIAGARASLEVMKKGDAADFAAQYESGLQGSTAIGYDKNGGTSYGKFQISSKAGTFDDWLKWLDKNGHEAVAQELRNAGPSDTGSRDGKTPEVWRALVNSGTITDDMQLQFIKESHLDPALAGLPKEARDAILADPTLYRAFFSTAVQHGADDAAKLIDRNWKKSGGDKEAFLDSLYADRKTQFASSTEGVQASVASRFDRERALLGNSAMPPEKIAAFERMLHTAKKDQLTAQITAAANSMYSSLQSTVASMPLEEKEAVMRSLIAEVPNRELRKTLSSMADDDLRQERLARDASDQALGRQYREYVAAQKIPPTQAAAGVSQIKGLSEAGREKLHASLERDAQKTTPQNYAALNEIRRQIDLGTIADEQGIDAYAFNNGLTDRQRNSALKYMEEGGNAARLSISKVEGIFKRMGKGKKMPEYFYDLVVSNLEPGKPATDQNIRQAIANLYMDGEISGAGWVSWGYGKDETYASAVRENRADKWLPDVSEEEEKAITAILRSRGVKVTEERIRLYKREELMKIPTRGNK